MPRSFGRIVCIYELYGKRERKSYFFDMKFAITN